MLFVNVNCHNSLLLYLSGFLRKWNASASLGHLQRPRAHRGASLSRPGGSPAVRLVWADAAVGGVLQRWAGNTVKRWDFLGENQRNLWVFLGKWPRNLGILEMTKKKWRFSWEEFSTLKNEIDVTIKNCIWCSMGINGVYTGIINHASWTWLFLHRTDLDWWIFVGLPCSNLHNIA